MYECSDCNAVFEEPEPLRDRVTEFERDYYGCPRCGSEYFHKYYKPTEYDDEDEESEEEYYE